MKNLIMTLIMSLMVISLFGQYIEVPDKRLIYDSITQEHYYRDYGYKRIFVETQTNTPGSELNLYVKHHYKGITFSLLGGVTMGIGGYMYSNSQSYYTQQNGNVIKRTNSFMYNGGIVFITTGSILSIIGMVYILEAPIHIKRASILLNENGVGIKVKL
jgi:hypothetical protein